MAKPLHPALLGRPIQALDTLAKTLSSQIGQKVQEAGHRSVALALHDAHWQPVRASTCSSQTSPLHIDLQRSTVQALMDARYGFTRDDTPGGDSELPASATEKRIAEQLLQAITDAVHMLLGHEPQPTHAPAATPNVWAWHAHIQVAGTSAHPLNITLGPALSAQLEARLARPRATKPAPKTDTALLPIELHALLLEKTLSAADIQNLQVGSVLPITLQRTLVHLNGQAMLTASVAEHHGKLHLTAFENLE